MYFQLFESAAELGCLFSLVLEVLASGRSATPSARSLPTGAAWRCSRGCPQHLGTAKQLRAETRKPCRRHVTQILVPMPAPGLCPAKGAGSSRCGNCGPVVVAASLTGRLDELSKGCGQPVSSVAHGQAVSTASASKLRPHRATQQETLDALRRFAHRQTPPPPVRTQAICGGLPSAPPANPPRTSTACQPEPPFLRTNPSSPRVTPDSAIMTGLRTLRRRRAVRCLTTCPHHTPDTPRPNPTVPISRL